jgi:hypothetical protein
LAYGLAGIPAAIGVWFVARFAYVTSDTVIDGASNAFLFGMLAAGAYAGPAFALAVAANDRKRAGCVLGLLALLAIVANWSHTLAAIAHRGAGIEAERGKAAAALTDARAELKRLMDEREAMTFTRATPEAVQAARDAVAAAERTRQAECGNGDLRQRGPNCRLRETEEQQARAALATAAEAAGQTERASQLEAQAAAIRARLAEAPAVKEGDALGAALGRLLPMDAATASTVQQGLVSAIVELLIAAALALPELLKVREAPAQRSGTRLSGHTDSPAADLAEQVVETPGTEVAVVESLRPADEASAGRFMLACMVRAADQETASGIIYNRYVAWCDAQSPAVGALKPRAFAQQFAAHCKRVGIKTRQDGKRIYCVGVALVA